MYLAHGSLQSTVTSVTEKGYKSSILRELLLGHCSRTFNRFFTRLQRKLGENLSCVDRQACVIIIGGIFGPGHPNSPVFRGLRES